LDALIKEVQEESSEQSDLSGHPNSTQFFHVYPDSTKRTSDGSHAFSLEAAATTGARGRNKTVVTTVITQF